MLNKAGRGYFPADQSWHTLCFYHKYPKKIRDVQEAPKLKEGAGNSLPFFFNYLKNVIFFDKIQKKNTRKRRSISFLKCFTESSRRGFAAMLEQAYFP